MSLVFKPGFGSVWQGSELTEEHRKLFQSLESYHLEWRKAWEPRVLNVELIRWICLSAFFVLEAFF